MIFSCVFNIWPAAESGLHPLSWVAVTCYILTAVLAFCVQSRASHFTANLKDLKTRRFWILIMLFLLLLGLNKQFDLQSLFTIAAKCLARSDGWYANRRTYQAIFITAMAAFFLIFTISAVWYFRNNLASNLFAIIGILFLLFFTVARASSFHYLDLILNHRMMGIKINWVLELSGIFLISLQAIVNLIKFKSRPYGR